MCLSQLCLKGLLLRFFLVSWVLVLTACGGGGSSSVNTSPEANKGGISLPRGLKTDLPANGVLNAYIIVDGGERQLMTINGDNAEISLTNVTEGEHRYIIEFEFILNTNAQEPLLLARAEKRLLVGPGVNPLFVADTDYDTTQDLDNDDVSNLEELVKNTSPFAGFRTTLTGNTSETGDEAQYSIVLTRQPTADVTISLNSSNVNEGTLNRSVLVFTVDNWDVAQTITVTGVNDAITDGNTIYNIVLNRVVSNDLNYNGEVFADVEVTNTDDDTQGYNVSPISGDTDEDGRRATFTVRLNRPPIAGSRVRINVTSSDTTEGTVDVNRLRFTAADWNIPQTVTVTGQDDNIDDDLQNYTIILAAAISQDPAYDGLKPKDVPVTNLDNDDFPVVTFDVSEATIAENGGQSTITATLDTASLQDITVTFSYNGTATTDIDYTVDNIALVIPAGSFSASGLITAVPDNVEDPGETIDIIIASVTNQSQISPTQSLRQITIQEGNFTIGGNVAGLVINDVLVLQNNGGDDLTITANGGFTFATGLAGGSAYNVTLQTPPVNKNCVIQNASGTVNGANVTNLIVNCFELDLMKATPGSKSVSLAGDLVGADAYNIYYSTEKGFDIANAQGVRNNVAVSPVVISNLLNGSAYYFVLEMEFGIEKFLLPEISSRPNEWSFNGSVNAMASGANGRLYLGGEFTSVGTYMGGNIPLKTTTGDLAWGDFPLVEGSVFVTIPDGSGGWYMGGDFFLRVGGVIRNNLVHILSNKTVDLNWNPNITGVVNALSLTGTTLYIGGDFSSVGADLRQNLAAVATNTNGVATGWNPGSNGVVNAIDTDAGLIYVGGDFTSVGGVTRSRLAALDNVGAVLSWDPDANGVIKALTVDDTVVPGLVYFVGEFTNIGGTIRNRIAAVDINGTLTSWDPSADGPVNALAINNNLVYLGGAFTTISTPSRVSSRINLAAVTTSTSPNVNVSTWNSANTMDGPVNALAADNNGVYVGGSFNVVAGQNRRNLLHISLDGVIDTSYPSANAQVLSLALDDNTVYVGGRQLTSIGITTRNYLAAINSDSTLSGWNPNANARVNALVINGTILYAGGNFTSVLGSTRNRLAAINTGTTATLDTWNPDANGSVNAIAIDTSTSIVYAGGVFTTLGGNTYSRLAAIDIDGIPLNNWNPAVDSDVSAIAVDSNVNAIAVDGNNIYIGGAFSSVTDNSQVSVVRNKAAVIDTDGALGSWNPDADANINTLAVDGAVVYIGGDFVALDSTSATPLTRNRLAAIATDGTISSWNPDADLPVNTLLIDAGVVYVGGDFTTMGGVSRASHLAAITTAGAGAGTLNDGWSPDVRLFPQALTIDGTTIYVGGLSEFSNGFVTTGTDGIVR